MELNTWILREEVVCFVRFYWDQYLVLQIWEAIQKSSGISGKDCSYVVSFETRCGFKQTNFRKTNTISGLSEYMKFIKSVKIL